MTMADLSIHNAKRAIVLLSGGLDSTTCLAIAQRDGFACYGLSFDYGQRHKGELTAAARIASRYNVLDYLVVRVDLAAIGGSALTATTFDVPKKRPLEPRDTMVRDSEIPITYVPARNTIFLSLAMAWAETLAVEHIFIGVNALDYSGYPDCRPAFLQAFERLATVATKTGVAAKGAPLKIHAPLLQMTKAEIIQCGTALGIDYGTTHSCYDPAPNDLACGACDACQLRQKGFADAGLADPTHYATHNGAT